VTLQEIPKEYYQGYEDTLFKCYYPEKQVVFLYTIDEKFSTFGTSSKSRRQFNGPNLKNKVFPFKNGLELTERCPSVKR